ncbi:trimethylguanosine synthase [Glossina fuscipes]|uniref:Trimethylguanosine synthase n=1 Tax=Glossina fuscipes TaxID=7396 RepID=A0A9C5Z6H1_9MUSC|nr:trimethylguanosine synthase [Glossina fuscipes]
MSHLPQFFHFSKILSYDEKGANKENIDKIVREFEENFLVWQTDFWHCHWAEQGDNLTLDKWYRKYKDFMLMTTKNQNEYKQDINLEERSLKEEEENSSINAESWNNLWHKHQEEIYANHFLAFTSIFYQYYLDLKYGLETSIEPKIIVEDFELHSDLETVEELSKELEQLQLLGLPIAFGPPKQASKRKAKTKATPEIIESISDTGSESGEMVNNDLDSSLHEIHEKTISKSKKKNRSLRHVPEFMVKEKGLLKYWRRRFSLFSRFDEGIRLDRESWFSVTPEKVAFHLAQRLRCDVLIDGFCGCGGNAIQFAFTCHKVIAVDIDADKLAMAKHNASIYGVGHKIEFILGDFLHMAAHNRLKGDVVFLSPPWGGPKYKQRKSYDIEEYLLPVSASELIEKSSLISENIAIFLPRNAHMQQIIKLAGPGNQCEIEHNYLDSRLVALTALYGERLVKKA